MNAFFDARCIADELSATRVYVRELLRRLPALAPEWTWHIVVRGNAAARALIAETGVGGRPNVVFETIPSGLTSFFGNAHLATLLIRRRCGIYFSPVAMNYFLASGAFSGVCKAAVVAVHGNPTRGSGGPFKVFARRFCLSRAMARCSAVVADSASLRDGLSSMLRLSPAAKARLRIVHGGVSDDFRAPVNIPTTQRINDATNQRRNESTTQRRNDATNQRINESTTQRSAVLLYVGCDKPHKNLEVLVRAFAALKRRMGGAMHLLVVCDDPTRKTRSLVRDLGVADDVSFVSVADKRRLALAYREATMLVSPSGHEGFSLPIVEAMASGTPIICCDEASRDEMSRGAALYAPPGDEHALCDAMGRMFTDNALRADCVRRGLERAEDFSWDKTASDTLDIMREAISGGKGAR